MRRAPLAAAVLALAALAGGSIQPLALAAGAWWIAAGPSTSGIQEVASNPAATTLVVTREGVDWYSPGSGRMTAVPGLGGGPPSDAPVAVAADGDRGVVGYRSGALTEVHRGLRTTRLAGIPGRLAQLALGGPGPLRLAAATSSGLYFGELGGPLALVAPGRARAVLAPPGPGLPWVALVGGRLWARSSGSGWGPVASAPRFGSSTRVLAELGSGVVLVAEPGGLVWRGSGRSWDAAFQLLPYGGLGGVPAPTALAADGAQAAYLASSGFGTLLTPDGGYSWYRAPPASASITALATVGPVFASRPHGFVVAVSPEGLYLHRLQALPQPPSYSPGGQTAELVGTALVTAAAALLATLALWLWSRRRRGRSLSSAARAGDRG